MINDIFSLVGVLLIILSLGPVGTIAVVIALGILAFQYMLKECGAYITIYSTGLLFSPLIFKSVWELLTIY